MKKNYGELDAYLKQFEARERILKQMEPFREIQEAFRKTVQPAYTAALLSPLAEVLPISASVKERPAGFSGLNRHTVLHGEPLDYGSKVNSLKAISLVNYVAHVLPADNP